MSTERQIATDQEGYIQDMSEWSRAFARCDAEKEGYKLTDEHWEVIWYIREYYDKHQVQAQVLDMIKHFRKTMGERAGNNKYLHKLFPTVGDHRNRAIALRGS